MVAAFLGMGAAGDLVGREADLAAVRTRLAVNGRPASPGVIISGEAGIGKTHLLGAALESDGPPSRQVVLQCSELDVDLPFAPFVRALGLRPDADDPSAAAVGRIIVDAEIADADLRRLRVIEAIVEVFERWCVKEAVLVAVDDLHWADQASLQVLGELVRRRRHLQVVIAGTIRPHPRRDVVEAFTRSFASHGGETIVLDPLTPDAMRELVICRFGARDGPVLSGALVRTGGNPLYVTELLTAATVRSTDEGHVVELPHAEVPSSVRQAIEHNLSALPAPAMDVLRTAAVLGPRFHLHHLALATERSERELLDVLGPALASATVCARNDRFEFRHELVRDVLYESDPAAVRASRHRQAVERLRAGAVPLRALLPHLLRADWRGVGEATTWLAEAAHEMRSVDLRVTYELLHRAVDVAGHEAEPWLRLDLAEVLAATRRPAEMVEVLQPVLSVPVERLSIPIRDRLVSLAGSFGSDEAAEWRRRQLLDRLESAGLSPTGTLRAASVRAWDAWLGGDPEEAERIADHALASAGDDVGSASRLELLRARIAEGAGRTPETIDHARRALAFAQQATGEPERALDAAATLGVMLGVQPSGQTEAEAVIAEAKGLAQRCGLAGFEGALDAVAGLNAERRGSWEEALLAYETALQALDGLDLPHIAGGAQIYARAARIHIHRDELGRAGELIEDAKRLVSAAGKVGKAADELTFVHIAEAELASALREDARALSAIDRLVAFVQARDIGLHEVTLLPAIVSVTQKAGEHEASRRAVERADTWLARGDRGDPNLPNVVSWSWARLAGDVVRLESLLAWVDGDVPLWEWKPWFREDFAEALIGAGRSEDAAAVLLEALALWEGAHAARDRGRVRSRLRSLGVIRGRGNAANRPDRGWASLTDAERRVLNLVREGLVYREIGERLFISRRTVESHVQRMFRKLNVSSRRDLSRLVATPEAQAWLRCGGDSAPR